MKSSRNRGKSNLGKSLKRRTSETIVAMTTKIDTIVTQTSTIATQTGTIATQTSTIATQTSTIATQNLPTRQCSSKRLGLPDPTPSAATLTTHPLYLVVG